jgi:hypothetical protein
VSAAARAALLGAGWACIALGLAGLVITIAALTRSRTDDAPDDTAAILQEVAG